MTVAEYMDDNTACHFISSLFSGFVYAFLSCPLDVAKTRYTIGAYLFQIIQLIEKLKLHPTSEQISQISLIIISQVL